MRRSPEWNSQRSTENSRLALVVSWAFAAYSSSVSSRQYRASRHGMASRQATPSLSPTCIQRPMHCKMFDCGCGTMQARRGVSKLELETQLLRPQSWSPLLSVLSTIRESSQNAVPPSTPTTGGAKVSRETKTALTAAVEVGCSM